MAYMSQKLTFHSQHLTISLWCHRNPLKVQKESVEACGTRRRLLSQPRWLNFQRPNFFLPNALPVNRLLTHSMSLICQRRKVDSLPLGGVNDSANRMQFRRTQSSHVKQSETLTRVSDGMTFDDSSIKI
jgi:hypothetical protein